MTVPGAGGPATTVIRTVGGAEQPAYQAVPARDLSLSVTVGGQPGYVGGADITVTYTVRNASARPATNVWLGLNLPAPLVPARALDARCDATAFLCRLGPLGPTGQTTVRVVLPARVAVSAVAAGLLTATIGERGTLSRQASAPVLVRQPVLTVSPSMGTPGLVAHARGVGFPPGATVRLAWDSGITAGPRTVRVRADGTFEAAQLVIRKDRLGPRRLGAAPQAGARFGPVVTRQPYVVVPRSQDPPNFAGRG